MCPQAVTLTHMPPHFTPALPALPMLGHKAQPQGHREHREDNRTDGVADVFTTHCCRTTVPRHPRPLRRALLSIRSTGPQRNPTHAHQPRAVGPLPVSTEHQNCND